MALLRTNLAGIDLSSPVILAAGTAGVLDEMSRVIDLARVGAVTTKSITPLPREGNETWRIWPAGPAGMLNAIGLANPGLDVFLHEIAPRAKDLRCKVFVSVAGFSVEDYVQCAANIDAFVSDATPQACNIHAIELNVSCPNVKTGTEFGHTPELIAELLRAVRPVVRACRVLVKLSPATPHLVSVCESAIRHGADALTLGNTYPAMAIDVLTRKPVLANVTGGLSGPGIHPIAVKHVYDVYRKVAREAKVPLIGTGGVMAWEHGAEFILAGATAFQIGTGLFADPRCPVAIHKGLTKWCGTTPIADLVGGVIV